MKPRIRVLTLAVGDLDRSLAFYRDGLGLPVARQGSFGAELFEAPPHLGIHPAVHPDARKLVGRDTGITFHVPGLLHYCGQLHDRGVRFVREPTRASFGIMAMVADPDGNVFALWEDAPAEETEGGS